MLLHSQRYLEAVEVGGGQPPTRQRFHWVDTLFAG